METETEPQVTTSKSAISEDFNYLRTHSESHDRQDIPRISAGETTGCQRGNGVYRGEIVRYPFLDATDEYISRACGLQAQSTIANKRRSLRYIAGILEELKRVDRIKTTHPKYMDREDVIAFIKWMREHNFEGSTQAKFLQFVDGVLLTYGNSTVQTMRLIDKSVMPKPQRKPIITKTTSDLRKIITAAEVLPGWSGVAGKFAVIFYIGSGLRPSEFRLAHLEDLKIVEGKTTFYVRFPKGADTWGRRRTIVINPHILPAIVDYLNRRNEYLQSNGKKSEYLIPHIYKDGLVNVWTMGIWSRLSEDIRRVSGINFSWKQLRATATDIMLNSFNIPLSDVSVHLGHASTKTTETYYARISEAKAGERIQKVYSEVGLADGFLPLPSEK